jgi:hypothetical protein
VDIGQLTSSETQQCPLLSGVRIGNHGIGLGR